MCLLKKLWKKNSNIILPPIIITSP
jgi:hypothetical protein